MRNLPKKETPSSWLQNTCSKVTTVSFRLATNTCSKVTTVWYWWWQQCFQKCLMQWFSIFCLADPFYTPQTIAALIIILAIQKYHLVLLSQKCSNVCCNRCSYCTTPLHCKHSFSYAQKKLHIYIQVVYKQKVIYFKAISLVASKLLQLIDKYVES